ncbi:DUF4198 domain-containing protein [Methylobacillus arboreus]|uniref:DUF4198 domain-containing protein n=1 Tax=Methylobacillus arboreus TaxID=755170 RepID=UPI001E2A707E|nr:DUF4198 domain-containing protein [Methylobacillus arboreus]MCB5190946.1 DUF4198 domain-containing protein [Methylobacillus arboreus]
MRSKGFKFCIHIMVAAFMLGNIMVAQADYLWLEPAQDGVRAYLGLHESGGKSDPASLSAKRAFLADGKDLELQVAKDALQVATEADGDLRLTAQAVGQDSVLHFYQAKLGRSEVKAVNDLELVPTEPNGNTFRLVWKGSPVAASQVNVSTGEGWIRTLKPAEDGSVSLKTPFPGLYILEVTARVNGSMTYQGKKYEDVRHTATLSFEVQP